MGNYLDRLNTNQKRAVMTTEGPLLVLAGAGSGKTTVLASRVAYILENGQTQPWPILAITFTNKAANEMKDRIEKYVGENVKDMWIGTFHSICVRILRGTIDRLGYTSDFAIYDSSDAKTLVKECIRELGFDEKEYPPKSIVSIISRAKNEMVMPEDFTSVFGNDFRMRNVSEIYDLYTKKLKLNNALDFDDLITKTVIVLKENEDLREHYRRKFKYILIDEYQDTNNTQYELISLLANENSNVCVVGDDDQSIYKFRGANIDNILNFEKDYEGAVKITLDENYRSTSNILNTANAVIANNKKRMGKNLRTSKGDGEKITMYTGFSEKEEASFIAKEIQRIYKERNSYADCAVLYRTNAQSRAIEEAMMYEAVPYKVLAGQRFYDRKEIKDVMAYLKAVYNPSDSVSLKRIINEPKRKIGAATLEKINRHEIEEKTTFYDIISNIDLYDDLKSAAVRIKPFVKLISDLRVLANELPVDKLLDRVLADSGYIAMLENDKSVESQTRLENVEEFKNVAREFVTNPETSGKLSEFIEKISLVSDIDGYDETDDCAVMMTIHSAKGLEFPVVFIAGLEEELFPSMRSYDDEEDIEEERRLCYVAITRAKEKLYMSRALSRFKYGARIPCEESRFMREVPREYAEDASGMMMRARNTLERNNIVSVTPEFKMMKHSTASKEKHQPAMDAYDYRAGDRVRHRKFGDGTVVSSQAFGNDAIVVIDFDTAGTKRLMAAFAKLTRIGEVEDN